MLSRLFDDGSNQWSPPEDSPRDGRWYAIVRDSRAQVALLVDGSPLARGLEARHWVTAGKDAGYVLVGGRLHYPAGVKETTPAFQ